jgi:leucyl-tRNA synthetase
VRAVILVLGQGESPEVATRCQAFGSFLYRLKALGDADADLVTGAAAPTSALTEIARAATVLGENDAVRYVPTRLARDRIAEREDGAWPSAIASRHGKVIRPVPGAIFDLPLETPDAPGQTDAGALQAFVTDWTGFPGSCAMAVHPAHPLSQGIPPGEKAAFTGRFCRHPLTGDLLPIWAATWVKAEFGTGAVLINPGHNAADLEFSRQVGLPVRFALVPPGFDGSPASWVKPPFIKSGVGYRTGSADGMAFSQAKDVYFDILSERGLAEVCTDSGMGSFAVAAIEADGPATVTWNHHRRTVAAPGEAGEPVRLTPTAVLSAVERPVREAKLTVVAPSSLVESDLLAIRLLLAEPGIEPAVKSAPEVVVVGNATAKESASEEVLQLALLVSAQALETVALKPQQIEPCERFIEMHRGLVDAEPEAGQAVTTEIEKAATQIKGLLVRRDLRQAFTQLYRLQKSIGKRERVGEGDLLRYLAMAYVFVGGPTGRYDRDAIATAWEQI